MADIYHADRLFTVCGSRTGIGTTELPVMLFRNPSGSGRTVKIKMMTFNNSHTVSSGVRFRVYASPTVTADGTGATEVAMDIGSGNTSAAEAFTSPTISANGNKILDVGCPAFLAGFTVPVVFHAGFQLRANQSILITAVGDGTNRVANVCICYEED